MIMAGSDADVLLVSDHAGRLTVLEQQPGESMFAAARRAMRGWGGAPTAADAGQTRYVNAGLHEVPGRMLPGLERMRQAGDVRTVLSARRLRTIENDFRTYSLTECVHPTEPGCIAGGGHDWASDTRIDGGSSDGLKSAHCKRPGCHTAKQWADQCDRSDAYETDVPFLQYRKLSVAGRAAHVEAYGGGSDGGGGGNGSGADDGTVFGAATAGFSTFDDKVDKVDKADDSDAVAQAGGTGTEGGGP